MIQLKQIRQQVLNAKKLTIIGGKTQVQTISATESDILDMSKYQGVIEYHPEELVITVKAGTKIKQLAEILAQKSQSFSFPLSANDNSTIGGAYAAGNSDLRDAVLGIKIIDGKANILNFGGQVMKNVAGYDVARLLVGSQGKLAVICEISFKLIPQSYAKDLKLAPCNKKQQNSKLRMRIEQGLKSVFDPKHKFI
ncbi:MAG: FAD-binding protein [Enterobacterales bacterium]|nr:FAD-binding protein [Enterobacterales bacterium]